MKRGLLFVVFSVWLVCSAQTNFRFADSTAQWNVLVTSNGGITPPGQKWTSVYTVKYDTIIDGKSYQCIGDVFLRRDSLLVYEISGIDTNEYLLYDFRKQAGDSITPLGIPGYEIPCIVDSVDSVFIGHYRKRMFVRYPTWLVTSIWIDGIGALNKFLYPESSLSQIPENPSLSLLCFFENGQLLYHDLGFDTCFIETQVGIEDVSKIKIHISPNPATSSLTIQAENSFPAESVFALFDLTGRMLLQKQLKEEINHIELSGVSNGMYLYSVFSATGKVGDGKLVVE